MFQRVISNSLNQNITSEKKKIPLGRDECSTADIFNAPVMAIKLACGYQVVTKWSQGAHQQVTKSSGGPLVLQTAICCC